MRAAQPNVAVAIEALGEEQGGPVEVGVHADGGDVHRHEERAEVEQGAGGGGEGAFRLRPASRKPPVARRRTPSFTVSGMAPQLTATNTEAAARSRKAPVPVTQTAPVRVGSGRRGRDGTGRW